MIPPPKAESSAGQNADVFISHSKQDRLQAEAICRSLESSGISCWIAPRNIRKGRDYDMEIMRGLKGCKALLLLFSAAARESPHVKREVAHAFDGRKPVVPIRLEDIGPGERFEYYLSTVQWFDAFPLQLESHLTSITDLLRETIGAALPQPPVQLPAPSLNPADPPHSSCFEPQPPAPPTEPGPFDRWRTVSVALLWRRDAIYSASLPEVVDWDGARVFLAVVATAQKAREIAERASRIWKLASDMSVESLIRYAMPGLRLSLYPTPPPMVPVKLNYLYFQVDLSGPAGEAVRRDKSISIYAPPAFDRVEMELILVTPRVPGKDL
jgi:hypothetical protein